MSVRRPLGFGKAAKRKKTDSGNETSESAASIENSSEAPQLEVELGDADGDQVVEEALGLYAKFKLDRLSPKVTRALVHECDSLLRSHQQVPDRIYIALGAGLLNLIALRDTEESHDEFRKLALERIDEGISTDTRSLAAYELLKYAQTLVNADEPPSAEDQEVVEQIVGKSLELIKGIEDVVECKDNAKGEQLAEADCAFMELSEYLETAPHFKEVVSSFEQIAQTQLLELKASSNPHTVRLANKGLGLYHLSKVAPYLDGKEDEEDEEEDEDEDGNESKLPPSACEDLEAAIAYFEKSLSDDDPRLYVTYAETLLPYADMLTDEKAQEETFALAVKHLRKAQLLGIDNLHDVISSLEN